jgi:cytochrome b subunit of formate dehydrogenase
MTLILGGNDIMADSNAYELVKVVKGRKYFFRFTLHQRLQHAMLAGLVLILVMTGMPLKFHDTFWAQFVYRILGGIHVAPLVHRVAGVCMILFFIYHISYMIHMLYRQYLAVPDKERSRSPLLLLKVLLEQPLMPTVRDLKEIIGLIKYYLFITDVRPSGGKWTWKDKFDYWAPFWGIPVLGITGMMMWGQEHTTRVLPGEILNYALIAHSDEALLAALFLLIWHMYNVHFSATVFPMGSAFLTGYLSERIMVEEHYDYYVELMIQAGLEDEILPQHGAQPIKDGGKEAAS